MYKKLFIVLLVWWLVNNISLQAQVTLALQVPPVGVMQKSQLWNMALINTGDAGINVMIELTLLSAKDNQPVLRATTRPIFLFKGTTQINAKDVAPVQYNYLSPVFNVDRDPNGFLPVGNYKVCYAIIQGGGHAEAPLTEDCLPEEVQPLSPPQLNLPSDTALVETAYPQFVWLPPLPVNLFSNLTYDMLIVEVLPGQGSYEAIQQNIPVYNISQYKNMVHQYPASNKSLDTGRIYAWRVIAKNEDEFVAQSEVWTFKLAAGKPAPIRPSNGNYIPLRNSNDESTGQQMLTERIIGIKYYSFDREHETSVRFLTRDGKEVRSVKEKIVYGENYLAYKLNASFQEGKLYLIELTDVQKQKFTAAFILKTN
ncbi:hypothetical protein ACX0G9_22995 [Flavitalea flava]